MTTTYTIDTQEWSECNITLPTERDFDPYGGNFDAQKAWKNFGNLTLNQAYAKFIQTPEVYQEDFMFMGGKAFAFYYPVIERHLHESNTLTEHSDCQAWILAYCIRQQFESKTVLDIGHLRGRIRKLIQYVLVNINKFAITEDDRNRIRLAWKELEIFLK